MLSIFPQAKSNVALALWGMVTVVAPIFGPILGGVISDNWSWPWIFYINIGFGAVVTFGVWGLLRNRETPTERTRIDTVGLALLTIGILAVISAPIVGRLLPRKITTNQGVSVTYFIENDL